MGVYRIIDEDDYELQLGKCGSKLMVITFFSTYCGHCKTIEPAVKKLCDSLANEVLFCEVDVDENEDIARNENVMGTPTFVLYKNKERVNAVATSNETKLKEIISQFK